MDRDAGWKIQQNAADDCYEKKLLFFPVYRTEKAEEDGKQAKEKLESAEGKCSDGTSKELFANNDGVDSDRKENRGRQRERGRDGNTEQRKGAVGLPERVSNMAQSGNKTINFPRSPQPPLPLNRRPSALNTLLSFWPTKDPCSALLRDLCIPHVPSSSFPLFSTGCIRLSDRLLPIKANNAGFQALQGNNRSCQQNSRA